MLPELGPGAGDGLFHEQAGTVLAEAGMRALRLAALDAGVTVLAPERVTSIGVDSRAVVGSGAHTVAAETVVVAAGPWTTELLDPLGIAVPLAPALAQVTFLDAPSMVGRPGIAEWPEPGEAGVYGHPVPGVGYKVALDAGSEGWHGDVEEWPPDAGEERRVMEWLPPGCRALPGGSPTASATRGR
jgi:glycine/D-amino acid oxidase-like deaminating enzyme